jgi:hypothetical protein
VQSGRNTLMFRMNQLRTDIPASSGVRTYDPSVGAAGDI